MEKLKFSIKIIWASVDVDSQIYPIDCFHIAETMAPPILLPIN